MKGLSRAAARLRERIATADTLAGASAAERGTAVVAEAWPAERTRLPIRAELLDPHPATGWLRTALLALHQADPAAAEAVFQAGLRAQGLHAPRPLVYDLVLAGHVPLRIALDGAGGTTLTPAAEGGGAARFCVRGDVPSLAPLVTGGVPRGLRPLPGVRYAGGWWALRRFLRTMRGPVGPGALGGTADGVEPLVALALVVAGLPAGAAEQEPLYVGFDLGPEAPPAHLRAGGGEPARSGVGVTRAAQATVHVAPRDLLGFLAGEVPAWGSGDPGALRRLVALLHPVRA